MIINHFTI